MTKLIESQSVTRDYGMSGTEAVVESNDGQRYLICDGFGGVDDLRGGAVRWEHGIVVKLQPDDTLECLKSKQWNDIVTLWQAVTQGHDDSRPVLEGITPTAMAKACGLS